MAEQVVCVVCGKPVIWSTLVGGYIHERMEDRAGTHPAVPTGRPR